MVFQAYKNMGKALAHVESDTLGGIDPYSASKAMADIAVQSWLVSFKNAPSAIARAGNVIGGGDFCADRLIPDLIHAYSTGLTPKLLAPNSIRPWQHVLDCLNRYLAPVEKDMHGSTEGAWKFGPIENQSKTLANVADLVGATWDVKNTWEHDVERHPREEAVLLLNSEKVRRKLGWSDTLNFEESVYWTTRWYKNVHSGNDPLYETLKNIREFEAILKGVCRVRRSWQFVRFVRSPRQIHC